MIETIVPLESFNRTTFELIFFLLGNYLATREIDVLNIMENIYIPLGLAEDDHLGWFKMQNNVYFNFNYIVLLEQICNLFRYKFQKLFLTILV